MLNDEIIDEVRAIRDAHAAKFAYDLRANYADLERSEAERIQASGKQLERIASLMEQRRIRSIIDTTYPLHDARKAHEKSRTFRTRGKLVLLLRTDAQQDVPEDARQAPRL